MNKLTRLFFPILILLFSLCACNLHDSIDDPLSGGIKPAPYEIQFPTPTGLAERPQFTPGELVPYIVQTGDSLPALAAHFNTTIDRILTANTFIPKNATTLPPGMPMEIPIYYRSFWGTPYQIIPDSHFINGPLAMDFNTDVFIAQHRGWLNGYQEYAGGKTRSAGGVIDYVAQNFSVSPRLLLAMTEYLAGGLSQPELSEERTTYPLGYRSSNHKGLYLQLVWLANQLNNGYYQWRTGDLIEFDLSDGSTVRPDPWQNAATVSLHMFLNLYFSGESYQQAIGPLGFAETYRQLFGDPWEKDIPHIPGSLQQPPFILPFEARDMWAFSGGPHTGWGTGAPFAAMDFAPPSKTPGCFYSLKWVTAIASGLVVRSETGAVILDLDQDGDERTGWVIFYLHIGNDDRVAAGTYLQMGDPIGHPSCEGGSSTGTHVHIARKYNGEWMVADGVLPFVMEGWIPHNGDAPYLGTLTRFEQTVTASGFGSQKSNIYATGDPNGAPISWTP